MIRCTTPYAVGGSEGGVVTMAGEDSGDRIDIPSDETSPPPLNLRRNPAYG